MRGTEGVAPLIGQEPFPAATPEVPVRTIDANDIVNALRHCDPQDLARALASSDNPDFDRISSALVTAAEHRAAYPRQELIAEGDALLYDVLRWPVEDANPHGITVDPVAYARQHQVSLDEAERVLHFVTSTESQACDQLLSSGAAPNFTLEQGQVYDCIVSLRMQNRVPTRQLVRDHAYRISVSAMRPEDGPLPLIYAPDPSLAPRVVSPSPKVHALLWMDRMDANPPATALLEQRIEFVLSGKKLMENAAREHVDLMRTRAGISTAAPVGPLQASSMRLAG